MTRESEPRRMEVGPWRVTSRQVGPGELRVERVRIVLMESTLEQSGVTSDVLLRGRGNPGHVTFTFVARLPRSVVVASAPLREGDILCYGPEVEFEGLQPAGSVVVVMPIPTERLRGTVLEIAGRRQDVNARAVVIGPTPDQRGRLEVLLAEIIELATQRPEAFDDERFRAGVEASLIEAWLAALATADADQGSREAAKRAGDLSAAFDAWLDQQAPSSQPSVAEACAALGVTRRSLERAIVATRGLPPADYIRRLRVHALRAALRQPSQAHRTIMDIALDHGFWHAGRLAAQYRSVFGESPSETRRDLGPA